MSPDSPGDKTRQYSDKEVGRLLKDATELQEADEAERRHALGSRGMSLATLQEVAAEAGIEPRYIQVAAARIDRPEVSGIGPALAGTPLVIHAERLVPGELAEEDYEQIVEEIRLAADEEGSVSRAGRTLTWKSLGSQLWLQKPRVTVVSRNGETRIQAREELDLYAVTLFGGVVGGGGMGIGLGVVLAVGMGVLGSALLATLIPVGLIGTLYLTMRQVMKSIGRNRGAKLERLVDRIAQCVQRTPS